MGEQPRRIHASVPPLCAPAQRCLHSTLNWRFVLMMFVSSFQLPADAPVAEIAAHLKKYVAGLTAGLEGAEMSFKHTGEQGIAYQGKDVSGGYFGEFGGRYIPETLVEAHRWGPRRYSLSTHNSSATNLEQHIGIAPVCPKMERPCRPSCKLLSAKA